MDTNKARVVHLVPILCGHCRVRPGERLNIPRSSAHSCPFVVFGCIGMGEKAFFSWCLSVF